MVRLIPTVPCSLSDIVVCKAYRHLGSGEAGGLLNILLIRNGFDLAHGLPTQYWDFLHFGQKVEKISVSVVMLMSICMIEKNWQIWK